MDLLNLYVFFILSDTLCQISIGMLIYTTGLLSKITDLLLASEQHHGQRRWCGRGQPAFIYGEQKLTNASASGEQEPSWFPTQQTCADNVEKPDISEDFQHPLPCLAAIVPWFIFLLAAICNHTLSVCIVPLQVEANLIQITGLL